VSRLGSGRGAIGRIQNLRLSELECPEGDQLRDLMQKLVGGGDSTIDGTQPTALLGEEWNSLEV
jgi:hypothetical protein